MGLQKSHFNCLTWFEFELEFISKEDILIRANNAQAMALRLSIFQ
jgi:hypothetical protein